jgi:hypothetical protein
MLNNDRPLSDERRCDRCFGIDREINDEHSQENIESTIDHSLGVHVDTSRCFALTMNKSRSLL